MKEGKKSLKRNRRVGLDLYIESTRQKSPQISYPTAVSKPCKRKDEITSTSWRETRCRAQNRREPADCGRVWRVTRSLKDAGRDMNQPRWLTSTSAVRASQKAAVQEEEPS